MSVLRLSLSLLFALGSSALPQDSATWAQCGGAGFTGKTTCPAGYSCNVVNQWYSQCGKSAGGTTPAPAPAPAPSTGSGSGSGSSPSTGKGKLKWVGVNDSGYEWGNKFPGTAGMDYQVPNTATIKSLIAEGYNIIRVPFAMERMAYPTMTSPLAYSYLQQYQTIINTITDAGAYAIVDAHNYLRYNNVIINDAAGFKQFWINVATVFKGNSKVIFDINNEPNTMEESTVLSLMQAGVDGVRAAGATSQYIFVEGNFWSGTGTWATQNDVLKTLYDPQGKMVYEMHEYLNSDGSGIAGDCPTTTIGVDRVAGATAWLKANGKQGIIGEFAGGNNANCKAALTGFLDHLSTNSDVWLGAVWWAAGPAWPAGSYGDFEPPYGAGYQAYNNLLKSYL